MKHQTKLLLIIMLYICSTGVVKAYESAFIPGRDKLLSDNLVYWRNSNPFAVVTNVNIESYSHQITTENITKKTLNVRGMHLIYYVNANNVYQDKIVSANNAGDYNIIAQGVVFIYGAGKTLYNNIAAWRKINPANQITAMCIEPTMEQIRTDEGLIKMQLARGMWVFYVEGAEKVSETIVSENHIINISEGVVFIEGADIDLKQRVKRFLNTNPDLEIRSSCIEEFTDQVWIQSKYVRAVLPRGMWIFYGNQNERSTASTSEVAIKPYSNGEEYLRKALDVSKTNPIYEEYLKDAQYWYQETINDYPGNDIKPAAELRLLYIKHLSGIDISSSALQNITGKANTSKAEISAIRDLIDLFEKNKNLANQLLLYQRIVKIYKNDPYSKEAYEAIKAIRRLNEEIKKSL